MCKALNEYQAATTMGMLGKLPDADTAELGKLGLPRCAAVTLWFVLCCTLACHAAPLAWPSPPTGGGPAALWSCCAAGMRGCPARSAPLPPSTTAPTCSLLLTPLHPPLQLQLVPLD